MNTGSGDPKGILNDIQQGLNPEDPREIKYENIETLVVAYRARIQTIIESGNAVEEADSHRQIIGDLLAHGKLQGKKERDKKRRIKKILGAANDLLAKTSKQPSGAILGQPETEATAPNPTTTKPEEETKPADKKDTPATVIEQPAEKTISHRDIDEDPILGEIFGLYLDEQSRMDAVGKQFDIKFPQELTLTVQRIVRAITGEEVSDDDALDAVKIAAVIKTEKNLQTLKTNLIAALPKKPAPAPQQQPVVAVPAPQQQPAAVTSAPKLSTTDIDDIKAALTKYNNVPEFVDGVADYLDRNPDKKELFDKMTRLKDEQPTHPVALQINNRWQIISANIKRTPQDAKKLTDGFFTWLEGKKQAIEEALQPQTAPKTTAPAVPSPIPSSVLEPMPPLPQKYAPQSKPEPTPPPIPARPAPPKPAPTPSAPTVGVSQEGEVLFKLPQQPSGNELASSITELRGMANPDDDPDDIYIEDADIPITLPPNFSHTPAPTTPPPDSDAEAIPDPLSETQRVADTDIVEEEPDTSTDDAETIVNSADVEREGLINPMLAKFLPANLVNKENPECCAIYNLILKEKLDVADLTRFIGNPEEYMKLSDAVDLVMAQVIDDKIADPKEKSIKSYADAKRAAVEKIKIKDGEIQAILDARGQKGLDTTQQGNLTELRGKKAALEKERDTADALEKLTSRKAYNSPRAVLELTYYYWKKLTDNGVNMESLIPEVDDLVETEREAIESKDKPRSGWSLFRPRLSETLKAIAVKDKAFEKIGDNPAKKLAELDSLFGASEGDVTKWLESLPDGVDKKIVTIRLIAYLELAIRERKINSVREIGHARKLAAHLRAARNSMIRDEVAKEGGDANAKMKLYIEKLNKADYEAGKINKAIIESTSKWAVGSRIAAGTALTVGGAAAALASLPALPIIMTALTVAGITKVITTGFNENIPKDRRGKIIKRNGVGALMTSLGAVGTLALGPWGLLASAIPGAIWGVKKYRDWRKKGKKK